MAPFSLLISAFSVAFAGVEAVTIYTTLSSDNALSLTPTPTVISPVVSSAISNLTAYATATLEPPPLPNPLPPVTFTVQLPAGTGAIQNLSVPQKGNFFGFSIELSIANQILGHNSTHLNVPFLNYLGGLRSRSGAGAIVRVGGNSQEMSLLFLQGFPTGNLINKTVSPSSTTPEVNIGPELFYSMANVSALLGVQWYSGLPFSNPGNTTGIAEIAALAEQIVGSNLRGLQLGNEPDLYENRTLTFPYPRPVPYTIQDYINEWNASVIAMQNTPAISNQKILAGPSVCCNIDHQWSIDQVLQSGFMDIYQSQLAELTVQHYPNNNCPSAHLVSAQNVFPTYLTHAQAQRSFSLYVNATGAAQQAGKPFVMTETNSASCGGFVGVSDSFAAALWGIDYALQLAYGNFSNVLFHIGGQNVAYNPFTPPPGHVSKLVGGQWSTGPIYYSALVVTEALGSSNLSQVVDLNMNGGNPYTPGYAIYENGDPARVVMINFMNDPTGANDYTASLMFGQSTPPTSVTVRYLTAPSVSEKHNISWAGQTYGGYFQSDGRPQGNVTTETVQCYPTTGCAIKVQAPSVALVFLTNTSMSESGPVDGIPATYPTSTRTAYRGPTINQAVLATSNGRGGRGQRMGDSTSPGHHHSGAVPARAAASVSIMIFGLVFGAIALGVRSVLWA